jgi:hypothetical protein
MLTVDSSTVASKPGGLTVNPILWLRHYPTWSVLWLMHLGLAIKLALSVHWAFWAGVALLVAANGLYWIRVYEHFRHGCANPAVILQLKPMLIAVWTDLSQGDGEYPVIKIIRKKVPSVDGERPYQGAKLATVALYQRGADDNLPCWGDFNPIPVGCVTWRKDEMKRIMDSFTDEDWAALCEGLKRLPGPLRPGLYHVRK